MSRTSSLSLLTALLAAAAALCRAEPTGANLVVNGEFEEKGYTENYKENCGSTYLIGWTCSQAGIREQIGVFLCDLFGEL